MSSKTVKLFCDSCGDDRTFNRIQKSRTLQVRGEEITADMPLLECPVCKTHQPDPSTDADPMVPFYNEYRRRHKMLTPTEIVAIRKRYALSHEAFAKILGMSPATLYRYEGGALQDDVHDNLIRLCRSHQSMNIIMTHRKDRVSPLQFRRFRQALANQGQDRAIPSKAKRHLPKFRVRRSSPSMR